MYYEKWYNDDVYNYTAYAMLRDTKRLGITRLRQTRTKNGTIPSICLFQNIIWSKKSLKLFFCWSSIDLLSDLQNPRLPVKSVKWYKISQESVSFSSLLFWCTTFENYKTHFRIFNPLINISCPENVTFLWSWLLRWVPRRVTGPMLLCVTFVL